MGITSETPEYSALRARVLKKFHTNFVVELSSITWEERILPILFELEQRKEVKKILENEGDLITLYLCKDLKDLSALRRLKDFPDETAAQELLDSWIGICAEQKSVVIVNPKLGTAPYLLGK